MRDAVVPSLLGIQKVLFDAGAIPESDVGSHRWIEPPEAAVYLESLYGVPCHSADIETAPDTLAALAATMWRHFASHHTAMMVDDSVKAYAVGGVAQVAADEDPDVRAVDGDPGAPLSLDRMHVLLLDPHVCDEIPTAAFTARTGRGAGWVPFSKLFAASARWMYICPEPVVHEALRRATE